VIGFARERFFILTILSAADTLVKHRI